MKKFEGTVFQISLSVALALGTPACANFFAAQHETEASKPISDPFGDFYSAEKEKNENMILRSKQGDRSFEVEIPKQDQSVTDFVVPLSPEFINEGKAVAASNGNIDGTYSATHPGMTDREIASTFPQGSSDLMKDQNAIESELGLAPSEKDRPSQDSSYLGSLDRVKQLYKLRRFEAALIEVDTMLRLYPTDPRLYEMRGTLLSRLGYEELAFKSWQQSLELKPSNLALRQYLEKRESRIPASNSGVKQSP